MIPARLQGKSRGHQDDLGPLIGETAKELGEPEVVAGAQAEGDSIDVEDGRARPRREDLGFKVDEAARDLDIVKVNFPVLSDDVPLWINDDPRVVDTAPVPFQKTP